MKVRERQKAAAAPGGGYFGTKGIPTAKQPPGAEAVNVKLVAVNSLYGKMRGGQL